MARRSSNRAEQDAHDQIIADAVAAVVRARRIPIVISRTYRRPPDVTGYSLEPIAVLAGEVDYRELVGRDAVRIAYGAVESDDAWS